MKKINTILFAAIGLVSITLVIASCTKDKAPTPAAKPAPVTTFSFAEEFDNVGDLAAKGWEIKNFSQPQGANAWGQGRYENNLGGNKAGKVIGMPAYSATNSPYDFISVDATAVNNAGIVNCWLLTPQTTVKNGDILSFWTRAMSDSDWNNFAKDRMQVRINTIDGSIDCGSNDSANVGKFTRVLLDINPTLANNDPGGYPQTWVKRTITLTGITGTPKARFGFRYFNPNGGLSGANASSLIGIDQLIFTSIP